MKLLLQRAAEAAVEIDGACVGRIGQGLLVLVCAEPGDTVDDAAYLARKVALMRIFSDEGGKMNRSVVDIGGAVLAVSQFTLAARWKKGNRPGFSDAAEPALGARAKGSWASVAALVGRVHLQDTTVFTHMPA